MANKKTAHGTTGFAVAFAERSDEKPQEGIAVKFGYSRVTGLANSDASHAHQFDSPEDHQHEHTLQEELMHHLPYAIFSVALGMIILSLLDYAGGNHVQHGQMSCSGYHVLFHSFHFLHILFAATGTVITFFRFSNSVPKALIVGTLAPAFFCMLSDVVLPYLAGIIMGVAMELHICFYRELHNVIPFLAAGLLNGMVLRKHNTKMLGFFSLGSHFVHILISSLASLFYMVSHGFSNWYPQMGIVFIFLVIAIVIPCTFSDVIVPMYFAGVKKKK